MPQQTQQKKYKAVRQPSSFKKQNESGALKQKSYSSLWLVFLFPLVVFYYECVFRITSVGGLFNHGTLSMLLYTTSYSLILYFFLSFIKNRKLLYILTAGLIFITAVPFIVQSLVYLQFKVFYDLNTIFYGSADAMGSYTAEMLQLIFSFNGLLRIFLFILPLILYLLFGRRVFPEPCGNGPRRTLSLFLILVCYGLATVLVFVSPVTKALYKTEYNYQSAVQTFGLFTGMRLDVQYLSSGGQNADFDLEGDLSVPDFPVVEELKETETAAPTETETEEVPIEYGYNQLDLKLEGGNQGIQQLNAYVSSLTPSKKNAYTGLFQGKNLIFITAEAFCKEVIDETLTPTLYRLATKGIQFNDYYQPASAGTTGGEYQNIFGMLPMEGGASFKNTTKLYNYMTIGSQLGRLGYYGKAFHNNSYTYYSRNLTHNNLGYSDGFMGMGNGMEAYVKNAWPQSDLEMIQGTFPTYADKQPFNVYYMSVSGHSGYSTSGNSQTKKNWESVAHLPYSDQVKGYLAANLELEKALSYLVSELEARGMADDTVICISTDHFPYGLDSDARLGDMKYLSELYGVNVTDYFQRDHSACILWCGSLEKADPIVVDAPTFSLDLLPTLSNLFGTEFDSRLFPGRDVLSDAPALVFNTNYDWKTEYGTYYASKGTFVPKDESIVLPEGYVESIKTIVRNKILYCRTAPANDYFRYLFAN